jgi:calcineurin-like phosphoesterase
MRVLFCGDVVGRSGRQSIKTHLPGLRRDLALDFVIANGENAAGGFGITASLCDELFAAGVDVVSGGNHSWDQREVIGYIDSQPRLLRPANYPSATPGRGSGVFGAPRGRKVMVLNVMGRLFMDPLDDPFACVETSSAWAPRSTPSCWTSTARRPARRWPWATWPTAGSAWWSAPTPMCPPRTP